MAANSTHPTTASPNLDTAQSGSTTQPSTTASMLPRTTPAFTSNAPSPVASNNSSSSSGTATPTSRTTQAAPSPRRASSSLAQNRPSIPSSITGARPGRRIRQHNSSSAAGFASPAPAPAPAAANPAALASTDGLNAAPSMFGFYSHHANPTTQQSSPGAASSFAPIMRSAPPRQPRSLAPPYAVGASSASPSHDQTLSWNQATPNASPRAGFLNLYSPGVHRHTAQPSLPTSHSNIAYRLAQSHQDSSLHVATDSSLLSSERTAVPKPFEETTTISFTWTIRDLHLLREEVELSPPPSEGGRSVSAGAGKSHVWTSQPVFGDGKWKLELVRTLRPLSNHPQHGVSSGQPAHAQESSTSIPSVAPVSIDRGGGDVGNAGRNTVTILSVYLAALVMDYTHANVELPASIMVALRPVRSSVPRRRAQNDGWMWRRFYHYTFHKEADLFTCHDLPSVSEMLHDVNVLRDDAIALTIQLGLGPGHARRQPGQLQDNVVSRPPFEVDGHHLVPRAVLDSLHGLLDDANTGDVRILVRERGILLHDAAEHDASSDRRHTATGNGPIVPFPVGSTCPQPSSDELDTQTLASIENHPDRVFVRDRVLWAHSSVLKSRSDYFHTMLASEFTEGIGQTFGGEPGSNAFGTTAGRHVRTLRIPDADFVTAYWFLRYLYTEDIEFADKEDVRGAILDEEWAKGADPGHLTGGSSIGEGLQNTTLVDWTAVSQLKECYDYDTDGSETRHSGMTFSMAHGQLAHGQPLSSLADRRMDVSRPFAMHTSPMRTSPMRTSPMRTSAAASNANTSGSLRQRTSVGGSSQLSSATGSTISAPASPSGASAPTRMASAGKHHTTDEAFRLNSGHRTMSNASASGTRILGTRDPHNHPCAEPGPASALSIFRLAHRYHMQDLSRLALMHIVATLTPQSAFPMLLATSMFTELHTRIKTYVHQHWHLVSHTHEFERCCDEVSVGMWGADAGKTMRAFVRSLVSPLRASQG